MPWKKEDCDVLCSVVECCNNDNGECTADECDEDLLENDRDCQSYRAAVISKVITDDSDISEMEDEFGTTVQVLDRESNMMHLFGCGTYRGLFQIKDLTQLLDYEFVPGDDNTLLAIHKTVYGNDLFVPTVPRVFPPNFPPRIALEAACKKHR